jgi:uncharacterized SAM-binding protein YcdF (DUF218 family)
MKGRYQPKYDAILVLGVSTKKALYKARVEHAVQLYKSGAAAKLIFSGKYWGGLRIRPKTTEASLMAQYARLKGIPAEDILMEEESLNTIGNFYFCKKEILEKWGFVRLLIITDWAHISKSKFLAQKVLGHKYHLRFVAVPRPSLAPNHTMLSEIRTYFDAISSGDDAMVAKLLANHPYYKPNYAHLASQAPVSRPSS